MTTNPHGARWIGTAVISASVVLYVAVITEGLTRGGGLTEWNGLGDWSGVTLSLLYALVGGVVLRHSARNSIGILVAVLGLIPLFGNLCEAVVGRDPGPGLVAELAIWVFGWYFFAFVAVLVPLLHVFPTGRPMPGVWHWWFGSTVAACCVTVLWGMFGPSEEGLVNPFEIPLVTTITPVLGGVLGIAMLAGLGTGLLSLGVRFRRSRDRERAQLKWFFFSVVVAVVAWVILLLLPGLNDSSGEVIGDAAFALPPLGILIAMTRHGLFDIDRLVSRTVTYAVVALVVAAIYVVPVLVLPDLLGLSGDVAVAGATLLAAAAFAPLRRRVQSRVDRRFNRARYDAERIVSGLSGRVQALADRGAVVAELGGAAVAALQPRSVAVWLRAAGS